MDSPTHFSESNLRRYSKGLRSSKKSLYAYSDYCEEKDGHNLGPRSISLTALHSEVKNGGLEPRMAQLETLEAKMASIEVSLSTTGRKRKNGTVVRTPKELAKELEVLRNALRDKENVIQSLKSQLNTPVQHHRAPGHYLKNTNGCIKPLSDNERRGVEERLQKVDKDMDTKRLAAKNLKLALERLDISDNIDVRIQQAELEYQLEREELNILNLEEESRNLRNCLEESDAYRQNTIANSLFSSVPDKMNVSLHAFEVEFDPDNPPFTVSKKDGKTGLFVTWASDITDLKKGDRLIEVNGAPTLSGTREDLAKTLSLSDHLQPSTPLRLVVLRCQPQLPQRRELAALRGELALVTSRLEEERRERRDMVLNHDKVTKERDSLRGENLRLTHRISYLEEQVAELQRLVCGSKGNKMRDSFFQKGPQVTRVPAEVAEVGLRSKSPENRHQYPTLRAGTSPTPQNHLRARLLETLRRVSPPGGGSVECLSAASEPHYYQQRKTKPAPPRKPARLSLPRATSVQSVDGAMDSSHKRSHGGHHSPLRPWPSVEQSISSASSVASTPIGKAHRCWPSIISGLRPATSLGLAAAKGSEKWC